MREQPKEPPREAFSKIDSIIQGLLDFTLHLLRALWLCLTSPRTLRAVVHDASSGRPIALPYTYLTLSSVVFLEVAKLAAWLIASGPQFLSDSGSVHFNRPSIGALGDLSEVQLLVLIFPVVAIVLLASHGLAYLVVPDDQVVRRTVVRLSCYAFGTQFFLLALSALLLVGQVRIQERFPLPTLAVVLLTAVVLLPPLYGCAVAAPSIAVGSLAEPSPSWAFRKPWLAKLATAITFVLTSVAVVVSVAKIPQPIVAGRVIELTRDGDGLRATVLLAHNTPRRLFIRRDSVLWHYWGRGGLTTQLPLTLPARVRGWADGDAPVLVLDPNGTKWATLDLGCSPRECGFEGPGVIRFELTFEVSDDRGVRFREKIPSLVGELP